MRDEPMEAKNLMQTSAKFCAHLKFFFFLSSTKLFRIIRSCKYCSFIICRRTSFYCFAYLRAYVPYLFEYNAQNFVRNFNQKLRVRVIHEFFHQHALFLFLFFEDEENDVAANWDTDINVTQEEFEQLFGESDDESGFKLYIPFGNCAYTGSLLYQCTVCYQ